MAAGLGFKTFTTGEVLTAADTNGYLMQGVLVFASAAARDAAITSPQEGQCCYLKDTDAVLTYSGVAWVGFDDSNAIQNTIVDAKGDIVAASGSDTPARLAVGANYGFLQADSGQATGLLWNNAAWTSYSPTITASSGSYTTASANGNYTRVGKLCVLRLRGLITTVGTGTNPVFSLPFTAATTTNGRFTGAIRENAATGLSGTATIDSAATTLSTFRYDNGAFSGSGYDYSITISYEVA